MSFTHSWLDIFHDEDMSIRANLSTVLHQFDFFVRLFDLYFIDDIVQSVGVDVEILEPIEFWSDWASSGVTISTRSLDENDTWAFLLDEILKIFIVVDRCDLEIFLVFW